MTFYQACLERFSALRKGEGNLSGEASAREPRLPLRQGGSGCA